MNLKIKKNNVFLTILLITFCLLASLFCALEFQILDRVVLPLLTMFLFSLCFFCLLNILYKDKFISKIFLFAMLVHLIFILLWQILKYYILNLQMPTVNTFMTFVSDNDGLLYHNLGNNIASNFSIKTLCQNYTGGLFPKIVGIIYYYFGVNPFIVCLVNSFIASCSAIFFYLLAKVAIPNDSNIKVYSLFCVITFSHVVNTSILMRDSYIVFFIYLSIFLYYKFLEHKNILYFLITLLSLYALYLFRPYAAFILLLAFIFSFTFYSIQYSLKKTKIKMNITMFFLLLLSPLIIGIIIFILYYSANFMSVFSVQDLITIRDVSYIGGSSDSTLDFGAMYSKFFLLPFIVGYLCLFFAPFPWEWILVRRLHYVPDMLILYLFLPSFFRNIKKIFEDKNLILITYFCIIFFMFSIYCITLGNSGAIHRLRGPFIPMIYLIAMYSPAPFLRKILNIIKNWRII